MAQGDYQNRMNQMRVFLQEMVLDGIREGVQHKLDEIRGIKAVYLSATASATDDLVYTIPAGKRARSKSLTLTNHAAVPADFDIWDGPSATGDHKDKVTVAANDSVVIDREYDFATSIVVRCANWLANTSYSFSVYEWTDTNEVKVAAP